MITQKRKPWLALLLSFLCAPIGYIYTGHPKRGTIIAILILSIFPASTLLIKIELSTFMLASLLLFFLLFSLAVLVDVYKLAKRQPPEYNLKFYNKWWVYIIIYVVYAFVLFPLAQNFTKENLIEAYKIPAGSMLPTLMIGDHFFVDKSIYKTQKIAHGDLVIFPFPQKPQTMFIKRVIGLPGDEIEIRNKKLYINNSIQDQSYIKHEDTRILPAKDSPRDNLGPVTVPENSLFVLGDNRDNSYDSRFWGFVPASTVKGKIANIYWSWDKKHSKIRWERIGLRVN